MSLKLPGQEPDCFDPNAFGMATLLGGLFVLGVASDMMINAEPDEAQADWARLLGYLGLVLIVSSIVSFTYSCLTALTGRGEDDQWRRPLLRPPTPTHYDSTPKDSNYNTQQQPDTTEQDTRIQMKDP